MLSYKIISNLYCSLLNYLRSRLNKSETPHTLFSDIFKRTRLQCLSSFIFFCDVTVEIEVYLALHILNIDVILGLCVGGIDLFQWKQGNT